MRAGNLRIPLDNSTGKTLTCALYRNVTNMKEIKAKLIDGSLQCCAITPKLIIDPFQVVVAANKAALAASANKLITKTVYTEVLFNLSTSKNISQALVKFGISDSDKDLIVCTIESEEEDGLTKIQDLIHGESCPMEDLSLVSNLQAIKKAYKIQETESKLFPLVDSIVSRIAASDFSS